MSKKAREEMVKLKIKFEIEGFGVVEHEVDVYKNLLLSDTFEDILNRLYDINKEQIIKKVMGVINEDERTGEEQDN